MVNEIRGLGIEPLLNNKMYECEVIGVGSEGCVHEFCHNVGDILKNSDKLNEKNSRIRVVTPRIPQMYMNLIWQYILRLSYNFEIDSMVINDLGLLNKFNKYNKFNFRIILGRTLIRTLEYTPWYNYFMNDETEDLVQANILHIEKLELLKKYKVYGVEMCATHNNISAMKKMQQLGIAVIVHYDNIIATIGRTCPVVRWLGEEVNKCSNLCTKTYELEFIAPGGVLLKDAEMKNKVVEVVPTLFCIGNVVYHKRNIDKNFPYCSSQGVIFDYRISSFEDIENSRRRLAGSRYC